MTEDKRSPLHDWHVEHGAEVIWEDGYPWAMHEGADPLVEYEAVRTATGIWDLYSTCKYEVTGPRRGAPDPAPVHELARRACRPVPCATAPSSTPTG